MEMKENEQIKQRNTIYNQKKLVEGLRRPFGVAVLDITDILNGKKESDIENEIFVPILQCGGEKDSLDSLIKKITNSKSGEINSKDHKGQGVWITLKMLHGDLKQVREEFPHLVSPLTSLATKMGFPEVILPGDIRNDLYLTLVSGDFSSKSSNAKNIEVTVKVCNERGQELTNVISFGAGAEMISEYRSVVYYHEEKPKWMETFRISIPIEDFYDAHLKFIFRHRSSVESKDKGDKPFAFAFIKLMNQNGTTLKDQLHNVIIYKVDSKKLDETELAVKYLQLPSTRSDLEKMSNRNSSNSLNNSKAIQNQYTVPGLTINLKDSFHISSIVCSTKLTQNIDLLGLLKWSSRKDSSDEDLKICLSALMKVDGEEIVKFLQDTLDSLFNILMEKDSKEFNFLVFEALVFIIGLISDRKYQHFRPVLDVYIQDNFSATLAYNKLIDVLKSFIDGLTEGKNLSDQIISNEVHGNLFSNPQESFNQRAMKSLEFLFKFIVRSRFLFSTLNGGKNENEFELSMSQLLNSLTLLISPSSKATLIVQGSCLKYIPYAIQDILTVFDARKLSLLLTNLIDSVPSDKLRTQKMVCILDIIHSECLFNNTDCRMILMPVFFYHIRVLMRQNSEKSATQSGEFDLDKMKRKREEELNICIQVLSDMLSLLCKQNPLTIHNDVCSLINAILPSIIQTVVETGRTDHRMGELIAIMIEIFRQMTLSHFDDYVNSLITVDGNQNDLLLFLMEMLMVFKDMVNQPIYPFDWIEMIMIQNSVILNTIRLISDKIKLHFSKPFERQIYSKFFHCCIAFLTQRSLQLENFSPNKKNKIFNRYKDMRKETAVLIRCMWFHLDENKELFIPTMIGPFLEMTLIADKDLRTIGLRIIFDMMEFEGSQSSHYQQLDANDNFFKTNFGQCERELITQLDRQMESGKGDEDFKSLFKNYWNSLCANSPVKKQALEFVETADRLMDKLLEYRNVIYASEDNKEYVMLCLMKILEFYLEKEQQEMYIRYLYKLCDLHIKCENFPEAAYVLKFHTNLLKWSEESLSATLRSERHVDCETHRELKEKLYKQMIDYFDRGKLWEEGLRLCKELAMQYEYETFNFPELSLLHQQMALFYDNIIAQVRHKPEYYRVSFYGKGFSYLLRKSDFIYRAKPFEKLFDFRAKLLNQFSNAQMLESLAEPGPEITESNGKYILVNQVEPVMNERTKEKLKNKPVHHHIAQYYESNEVRVFRFSRVDKRNNVSNGDKEENEFASMWIDRYTFETAYPLPGISNWFPVFKWAFRSLSPIENAINTMETTNARIKQMVLQHIYDPSLPINPLTMMLNGVVDAAVMGGISNYEKAFFTEEYAQKQDNNKDELNKIVRLKEMISAQIPILEMAISLHGELASASIRPLHDHIEEVFRKMKDSVESKYGRRPLPVELNETSLVRIRRNTQPTQSRPKPLSSRHSGGNGVASLSTLSAVSQSSADLHKHSSLLSLTTNSAKTLRSKSVFIRPNSNQSFSSANLALNSNTLQSIFSSGTSTLTKFRKSREVSHNANQSNQSNHSNHSNQTPVINVRKSNHENTSHWYDEESCAESTPTNGKNYNGKSVSTFNLSQNGLIELRESLTAQRPLRSDFGDNRKQASRPTSGGNFLNVNSAFRSGVSPSNSSSSLNCSQANNESIAGEAKFSFANDESPPSLPLHPNGGTSLNSPATNSNIGNGLVSFTSGLASSTSQPLLPLPSLPLASTTNVEDDDNEPPPPLPIKHSTSSESGNIKFDSNGYSGTFIKQRNSCSAIHLKKKPLPPPIPSPGPQSSGSNPTSPYSSTQNTPVKSPPVSLGSRSPMRPLPASMNGRHPTPNADMVAYEQIPPLPKKSFRPVPPLPPSLDVKQETKLSDETEV